MLEMKGLISGQELRTVSRIKRTNWITESIFPELIDRYINNGWSIDKKFKTRCRMKKHKSHDILFEDRVWTLLYDMGFSTLNKDRSFRIPLDDKNELDHQIDVIAADDEIVLVIECKSTQEKGKIGDFKEVISGINSRKQAINRMVRKSFKGSSPRVRFILATNNFILNDRDKKRLIEHDIYHINDRELDYYFELTNHLGWAAKYQFLGNLFAGRLIPNLNTSIPAVSGKIGGHTFYSFSIEPSTLLKFSYVLHRNDANMELMPTYQRMIKKTRLKSIGNFLNKGGFFPNSIVINIDNGGKDLNFDLSNLQNDESIARIGIVHLPKKYRSAYIIDGQHRLYGYTNSKYATSNTIPVVAFINLSNEEQLKLFMEINENQKTVPKNLRTTLAADLDWKSDSLKKQVDALETRIAQFLGTEPKSPLYEKVIIGENPATATRKITLDAVKRGLKKGNLTGTFDDTKVLVQGLFYSGNLEEMQEKISGFLLETLKYIRVESKEFDENGIFLTNPGIESLLRIISDIVDHLTAKKEIHPLTDPVSKLVEQVSFFLDPLLIGINEMSAEEKEDLQKRYGAGAPTYYLRTWQQKINFYRTEFEPEGLHDFWEDNSKKYNKESFSMIETIETHLKKAFKEILQEAHGEEWFVRGLPKKVYDQANKLASEKKYENPSSNVDAWDCLYLIDYREIAVYPANWQNLFSNTYTYPAELKKQNISKDERTKWIVKLNSIRNDLFHDYSIKKEDYEYLKGIYDWILQLNML